MFAGGKMTDQVQIRKAMAFMGNLTALLGLLVLGFPLTPATIRTTLLGWLMMAVAITRFFMGHHSQTTESSATLRMVPLRSDVIGNS
jgi:uncharacterized membrane protein HdeD (DUF308 family)